MPARRLRVAKALAVAQAYDGFARGSEGGTKADLFAL